MTRQPTARPRSRQRPQNGLGEQHDPIMLWAELRHATEGLFDALHDDPAPRHAATQRKLFLALELQCKLQELAVLPAVQAAGVVTPSMLRSNEEDIAALRELVVMAQRPDLDPTARQLVIAAVDNIAELQFENVQGLLYRARHSGRSDGLALHRDMDALLARWREEIARTGDIEDEEVDPVGLPPR